MLYAKKPFLQQCSIKYIINSLFHTINFFSLIFFFFFFYFLSNSQIFHLEEVRLFRDVESFAISILVEEVYLEAGDPKSGFLR